jgi:hypothetical protein
VTIHEAIECAKAAPCSECRAQPGEWCQPQPAPPTVETPHSFIHGTRLIDGGLSILRIDW